MGKLTNGTVRFEEPRFHPSHDLVKREQLKNGANTD